jgi:hypothetical protein
MATKTKTIAPAKAVKPAVKKSAPVVADPSPEIPEALRFKSKGLALHETLTKEKEGK